MNIVNRTEFRDFFQPSRIVLLVMEANNESKTNIITLAFNMHCAYEPPMFAFSIMKGAYSLELLKKNDYCSACIPGQSLVEATLYCGEESGRDVDKAKKMGLRMIYEPSSQTPHIEGSIGVFDLKIDKIVESGDHYTFISEVVRYKTSESINKGLLSIGADTQGYKVLKEKGVHRIAIINND